MKSPQPRLLSSSTTSHTSPVGSGSRSWLACSTTDSEKPSCVCPPGCCLVPYVLRSSLNVRIPAPPPVLKSIVLFALRARAFFIRHCLLPRWQRHEVKIFPDHPAFPEGFVYAASGYNFKNEPLGLANTGVGESQASDVYAPRMFPQFYDNEAW